MHIQASTTSTVVSKSRANIAASYSPERQLTKITVTPHAAVDQRSAVSIDLELALHQLVELHAELGRVVEVMKADPNAIGQETLAKRYPTRLAHLGAIA